MKAKELNSTHIGEELTVNVGRATVRDVLTGINSTADIISHGIPMSSAQGHAETALGRRHLTLTFQAAGDVAVDGHSEVTIHA